MTFEFGFYISRTAVEIIAVAVTTAAIVYLVQDVIKEEESKANDYSING